MGFIFNFTNESEYYSPQYVLSSESIQHTDSCHGAQYKYSECYMTWPPCHQWTVGFNFNFASRMEYYSPHYVLSSRSPFNTATRAARHSMDTLNVIRHSHHAINRPRDLFL